MILLILVLLRLVIGWRVEDSFFLAVAALLEYAELSWDRMGG